MPSLRDFIPPAWMVHVNRLRGFGFTRLYHSAEEAASACSRSGYSGAELVRVVQQKTISLRDSLTAPRPLLAQYECTRTLLAVSLALANQARGQPLRVIDFGGACGVHYFLVKALFPHVAFKWCVVELAEMAKKGKDLFESDELCFFDSLVSAQAQLRRCDLLYSSGCLHYPPDPCQVALSLLACNATFLFLTRVGLTTGDKDLFTTQRSMLSNNGPGPLPAGIKDSKVEYPATFVRKSALESILRQRYRILLEFDEASSYRVRHITVPLVGYFCHLQNLTPETL
jgi:putative methyltransferase (TIGR04325 family)